MEKIAKCVETISSFLQRKKVTLKDLQSLMGLLNFARSVIEPGRLFLRRLIDHTQGTQNPRNFIRLRYEVKADWRIWQTFLSSFNGVSIFRDGAWFNSNKLNLFTDASGSIGFGAIFGSEWCYGRWPSHWLHGNIAILEFYPIVLSLCLWGHRMRNQSILFFTDNHALVSFVRRMVLICLQNNMLFKAKHIPGIHNKLADCLSRFQVSTFKHLAPTNMNNLPTDIPLDRQPQRFLLH
jgi:hypothetical protein